MSDVYNEELSELRDSRDEAEDLLATAIEEKIKVGKLAEERLLQYLDLHADFEDAQLEILKLKAELYDLITADKK